MQRGMLRAMAAFRWGTWVWMAAWLAAGGIVLIGAAVAMERNDVSPIEAGRRVVDVIGTNFD